MSLYHSGVEARDPVEGHDRDHEGEDGHEDRGEPAGAHVEGGILRVVLPQGAAHEERPGPSRQRAMQSRVRAEKKGMLSQSALPARSGFCSASGRVPGIEHRERAQGDEAPRAPRDQQGGEALGQAADGHAPAGAHQVLEGHEEERARGARVKRNRNQRIQLAQKRSGPRLNQVATTPSGAQGREGRRAAAGDEVRRLMAGPRPWRSGPAGGRAHSARPPSARRSERSAAWLGMAFFPFTMVQ